MINIRNNNKIYELLTQLFSSGEKLSFFIYPDSFSFSFHFSSVLYRL